MAQHIALQYLLNNEEHKVHKYTNSVLYTYMCTSVYVYINIYVCICVCVYSIYLLMGI